MHAPEPYIANPIRTLARRALGCLGWLSLGVATMAAPPMVQLNPTTYQTEHCLFIVDSTVTWSTPATAYNDIYGAPFTRLSGYFDTLTTLFPGAYFSVCYIANTGANPVPNYIDRIFKATGIVEPGTPGAPQSFATVDFCRYNLAGSVGTSTLGVFDHELGHAWGAHLFASVSSVGPGILSNGHWLGNSTIDCQLAATLSNDGGVTVDKIYGDPTNGFRYQRVDNLRSNDYETFSEQQLYLMGLRETFPTTYVLNGAPSGSTVLPPTYNADGTMSYASLETYDHAAVLAAYGARSPDYRTAAKQFKLGFVYIARDAAEVTAVYQAVEQSVAQFCTAEVIDPVGFRFQTPFLVDAHFRASVDGRLGDLDGHATPTMSVTDGYTLSTDGAAVVNFVAADAAGPAPTVTVIPASTQCAVAGSAVTVTGLPDGVHFFTLKAANAAGKKAFGHFVVEVHRPSSTTAISSAPTTQTVLAGATATFSVAATGTPAAFSYQWFLQSARTSTWNRLTDGGAYSGATSAALSVASSTAMDGDQFLCVVTNVAGSATSGAARLVVNEAAPAFTTQPANRAVSVGNVASFSVVVAGAPVSYGYFTYQWQRLAAGAGTWTNLSDGGGVTGATTAGLAFSGTTLAMDGDQVRCVVTNTAGTVTSNAATLTINQVPVVTTQPVNVTAAVGSTVSFTVVASGTAPLTYQWSAYSTPVPGGTGPTLTLTNIQVSDAASYSVYITNAAGATRSNAASLTVTGGTAPTITAQPQGATVVAGAAVSFSVTASGSAPLTYQWSKGGVPIAGATSATYSLAAAQLSDAGSYSVSVANTLGTRISSSALLVVNAAPPAVVTPPQGATVFVGGSVSLNVSASGTAPLTYQWQRNSSPVSGATAATYAIASAQASDAGSYTVVVTNSAGSVTSAAAVVTVNPVPVSFSAQPQSLSVLTGSAASFAVTVAGTPPFSYQWAKDGGVIAGATAATYALASVQMTDAGSYAVTVTNAAGSATSAAAVLTVTAAVVAPSITTPPQGATVTAGASVTFTVGVTGTSPFTYQWLKNSAPIAGATAASYAIASSMVADAGSYAVTVTNSAGSATSAGAVLAVNPASVAPTITSQPQGTTVAAGATVTLTVGVGGTAPFAYQWSRDGVAIGGATAASLVLGPVTAADAGVYQVTVTNAVGTATSQAATVTLAATGSLPTTVLINLSVRTAVAAGQRLIQGFVTNGPKTLLVRVAGPTLTSLGIGLTGQADPMVQLYNSASQETALNDDWNATLAPLFTQVGAFPFDAGGKDAALVATVNGLNSAVASGPGSGTVLMELYDPQTDFANRLVNLSARNHVGTGADALIVGFVITGTGTKRLLIRGVGPTLADYGVTGALADPILELYPLAGEKIAENDDWDSSLNPIFTQVGAFALGAGSKDAALLVTLPAGVYSVKLTGRNQGTGEGLVEVYEVWP